MNPYLDPQLPVEKRPEPEQVWPWHERRLYMALNMATLAQLMFCHITGFGPIEALLCHWSAMYITAQVEKSAEIRAGVRHWAPMPVNQRNR